MDEVIDDLDENGNINLSYGSAVYSPEALAIFDAYHKENGIPPISPSFYEATSPSTDYIDNATDMIRNLLNERRTEVNDGDYEMVFVWDLGEITTLTGRHSAQIYTYHLETNAQGLLEFSKRIFKNENFCLVYDVCNVVNIEDVDEAESGEMKERASSYYALEKFYNEITDGMIDDRPLISYELIERCGLTERLDLYFGAIQLQRIFHQRWKTSRKCLELVNKQSDKSNRKYANVVMSPDGIGNGANQLLVASCSKHVCFENIYNYADAQDTKPMDKIFERIQKRFGEKCVLVYITSEPDKASIPEKLQIPIWEVKANDSIEHLYNALQQNLFQ